MHISRGRENFALRRYYSPYNISKHCILLSYQSEEMKIILSSSGNRNHNYRVYSKTLRRFTTTGQIYLQKYLRGNNLITRQMEWITNSISIQGVESA